MSALSPVAPSDPSAGARTLDPTSDKLDDEATSEVAIEDDDSLDWFVNLLLAEIASES